MPSDPKWLKHFRSKSYQDLTIQSDTPAQPQANTESNTSTSHLRPENIPSSSKGSSRKKTSSFVTGVRGLFSPSKNNSSTSLVVPHAINPTNVVAGGPSGDALHHEKSHPITASNTIPITRALSSPPMPEASVSVHSPPSTPAIVVEEAPDAVIGGKSEVVGVFPVTEKGHQEGSWKDNLRTAYNGFNQVLNIAAESSDVFPPLKSVLGGLRATIKAFEVSSKSLDIAIYQDLTGSHLRQTPTTRRISVLCLIDWPHWRARSFPKP